MQTMAGCGETRLTRWIQLHYELDYHLNGNKREMLKYTDDSLPPSLPSPPPTGASLATENVQPPPLECSIIGMQIACTAAVHGHVSRPRDISRWRDLISRENIAFFRITFVPSRSRFHLFFFCPSIIAFLLDKDSFDFLERMIAWRWGNCSIESFFFSQLQRQSIACKED